MSGARTRTIRRTGGALAALALAAAALTGCTTWPESSIPADECTPAAPTGDAAASVTTSGAFGDVADPTFPQPLRADSLQVARDGAGTGAPVTEHGVLLANLELVVAETGDVLVPYGAVLHDRSGRAIPATMQSIGTALPGVADSLRCARTGERVVAVMPAAQALGDLNATRAGLAGSSIVVVADVLRVFASSAGGRIEPPQDGVPAVVTAPSGRPGVTMPQSAPPSETRVVTRIQGFGPAVEEGRLLTLHVSVFNWATGDELLSTWSSTNSVAQLVASADDGLYGVTDLLVGQRVGSQVVVILPPSARQGRLGPLASGVDNGQTLVFVVDVLAADDAQ